MAGKASSAKAKETDGGKLRIGDDWNAIRIIALSRSNPLKAIAEFVENSIDAHANRVTITRGREHGKHYLSIKDDGDGVPRDPEGSRQRDVPHTNPQSVTSSPADAPSHWPLHTSRRSPKSVRQSPSDPGLGVH